MTIKPARAAGSEFNPNRPLPMNTPAEWSNHLMQQLEKIPANQFHRTAHSILFNAVKAIQGQVKEDYCPAGHREFAVPIRGKDGEMHVLRVCGPFPVAPDDYDDLLKIMGMFKASLTFKPEPPAKEPDDLNLCEGCGLMKCCCDPVEETTP